MLVALGLDIQQGAKHGVTGVNDRCIGLIRVLGGDHCNHFTAEVRAAVSRIGSSLLITLEGSSRDLASPCQTDPAVGQAGWRWRRCSGKGITGSWSSGRGCLGGRPRRRLVMTILPETNS